MEIASGLMQEQLKMLFQTSSNHAKIKCGGDSEQEAFIPTRKNSKATKLIYFYY